MPSFNELIEKNLDYLSKLTKDEAELIVHVMAWDVDQRCAFKWAKRMFEEDVNDDTDTTR